MNKLTQKIMSFFRNIFNKEVLMKQRVVCDVNIWYRIGEGEIDPKLFKDYCLVGSVHNAMELASSENLIEDPEMVKRAILAMDTYACEIISLDPFDHIIKQHIDPSYQSSSEQYLKGNYEALLSWAKGNIVFELNTEQGREKFRNDIESFNLESQKYIVKVNEKIPEIRINKKYDLKKKKEEFEYLQFSVIAMMFEIISSKLNISKSDLKISTQELEFMIRAWTRLYRNVIMNAEGKLQTNDPEDKAYLAYVGRDDLFWSVDYKFLNKISLQPTDPNIEKFLFDKDRTIIKD